ncbi:MAG: metallophosphatase family protein [Defluviitaleaceae bacterium]|nr:metallophosphatase family protein [Defluviitaleaceae bacterium]MCL2273365.1 metallophosphatase family protein [Defluviitaleaceae bacterium]
MTAILTDIHGNIRALEAVLADLPPQTQQIWTLGDTAGGGPFPADCINRLIQSPLPVTGVLGNWEAQLLSLRDNPNAIIASTQSSLRWTADNLQPEHWTYLENLPTSAAVGDALLYHASPDDVLTGITSRENAAAIAQKHPQKWLISGHVHKTQLYRFGEQTVVTVGSVGLSADGIGGMATYAVLDGERMSLRHVMYDAEAAISAFHASPYGQFIEPYISRAYVSTLRTGENWLAKFFEHMQIDARKKHGTTPDALTPAQWEEIANGFAGA